MDCSCLAERPRGGRGATKGFVGAASSFAINFSSLSPSRNVSSSSIPLAPSHWNSSRTVFQLDRQSMAAVTPCTVSSNSKPSTGRDGASSDLDNILMMVCSLTPSGSTDCAKDSACSTRLVSSTILVSRDQSRILRRANACRKLTNSKSLF